MRKRVLVSMAALAALAAQSFSAILVFQANLDGLTESPPNSSPGTGFTTVTVDTGINTMRVEVTFSGLLAGVTASHIHARADSSQPNGGVATMLPTFTGFPSGVTAGSYDHTFDMLLAGSYNPSFITANGGTAASAWVVLQQKMLGGLTYLNIHTSQFPGGEIRGNLVLVPEPASLSMLAFGAVAIMRRRRR